MEEYNFWHAGYWHYDRCRYILLQYRNNGFVQLLANSVKRLVKYYFIDLFDVYPAIVVAYNKLQKDHFTINAISTIQTKMIQ